MDHIDQMDVLRRGIGLKAYGNEDPVNAYKKEGFEMFDAMVDSIHQETVMLLMHVNIEKVPVREEVKPTQMVAIGSNGVEKSGPAQAAKTPGRNDPCPCGSGKKYKNCCGANK
jgi:preprotein translocase subunit SecA